MKAQDIIQTIPFTMCDLILLDTYLKEFHGTPMVKEWEYGNKRTKAIFSTETNGYRLVYPYKVKILLFNESTCIDIEFRFVHKHTLKLMEYGEYKDDKKIGLHYQFALSGELISTLSYNYTRNT